MRILLLSDIHANLEAMEACLAAAPAYDLVANLGDVVGYGASPNEVIDRSLELGNIFVRRNFNVETRGERRTFFRLRSPAPDAVPAAQLRNP